MDVIREFNEIVAKYRIPPSRLRIEITETVMMNDSAEKLKIINSLRKAGFVVEMDDFGSGYSSLNMLNDTPVDMIKIDMMFLRNIQDQTRTKTILRNMVNMMTELGLPSIAEGVETPEQFQMLSQIGCSYFQGYLFARPVCVEEFEEQFLINGG